MLIVDEHANRPELPFCQQADDYVRFARGREWVRFEPLNAGVVDLRSNASSLLALHQPRQHVDQPVRSEQVDSPSQKVTGSAALTALRGDDDGVRVFPGAAPMYGAS